MESKEPKNTTPAWRRAKAEADDERANVPGEIDRITTNCKLLYYDVMFGISREERRGGDNILILFIYLIQYPIRDKVLLIKSLVVLSIMISMFLLHSVPRFHSLSYAWVALFSSLLLLILAGESNNFDRYMHDIEWATLLFFAALFVLMECLADLGLVKWMGNRMIDLINMAQSDIRHTTAILCILWVSVLALQCNCAIFYFLLASLRSPV